VFAWAALKKSWKSQGAVQRRVRCASAEALFWTVRGPTDDVEVVHVDADATEDFGYLF
jgi:hypothetical protein